MISRFAPGFLVVLTVVGGCGKGPKLPTLPVTGQVTYKGQVVADAHVDFIPEDNASGKAATGITDAQGRFTVQTHVGGSAFANGALAGNYIVTVKQGLPTRNDAPIMSVAEWSKLSEEERTKAKSGSMMKMQRPGEKPNEAAGATGLESALPPRYADVKKPLLKASVAAGGTNDFPFELTDAP